ncbi:hypothetical protein HX049_02580 [Myroides odoratimimus]|uniref:hypothetical protein n=1 Tax=Myroides odoratimimus TaxID=76832 RepID=UPI002578511A|nr:hypothetical protein [Myroides odoratimimus]MDM1396066.1 hypothetical protein [Myroides odoratimimus]
MALTPGEFQINIETATERVATEMLPVLESAALAAKALVTRRILAEGFGRKYTSKPYINYRLRLGRSVEFVNLSLTGLMFQGWNVPESKRVGNILTAGVKGGDNATAFKLTENKKRYPEFDLLNEFEKDLIIETYLKPKYQEILKKVLSQ